MTIDHDYWKLGLSEPDEITWSREEAEQIQDALRRLEDVLHWGQKRRFRPMPQEARDILCEAVCALEGLLGV